MTHDDLTIVAAKVVTLELLVGALFKDIFSRASNPQAAIQNYAERLKQSLERGMKGGPHDPATILMTEHVDLFFDAVARDLKAGQAPPQP